MCDVYVIYEVIFVYSEEGWWFVLPFSITADQDLKPSLRIKCNFNCKVTNEKENWFLLRKYIFTLITMQWSNCAADLALFKVIWYWSAFSYNVITMKLIKCNSTQIPFSGKFFTWEIIVSQRKWTDKSIAITLSFFFSLLMCLYWVLFVTFENSWEMCGSDVLWTCFLLFNLLKCTTNVNKELKMDFSERGSTLSVSLLQTISEFQLIV